VGLQLDITLTPGARVVGNDEAAPAVAEVVHADDSVVLVRVLSATRTDPRAACRTRRRAAVKFVTGFVPFCYTQ
jgi:hypothetical protein